MEISHKMNEAYNEQLNIRQEHQSTGSVSGNVYKSYLGSVESPILITAVISFFVTGQIVISAIDLVVSNW